MIYVIVTASGNWGKAESLNEAAKHARVRAQPVRAKVMKMDPRLHSDVGVDGMGGVVWNRTDQLMEAPEPIKAAVRDVCNLGYFNIKMSKGNLVMQVIE